MSEDVRQLLFEIIEASLEAQLSAVRRLRKEGPKPEVEGSLQKPKGASQLGMVEDVLREAGSPLHISAIIDAILKRFGRQLDRESLGSSLVKRVNQGDRFGRTAPNTFTLLESPARKGAT